MKTKRNFVLFEVSTHNYEGVVDGVSTKRHYEITLEGYLVILLLAIVAALLASWGIGIAWRTAECRSISEVTGLETTYRNISGCFIEAEEGIWITKDAYFVGKIKEVE